MAASINFREPSAAQFAIDLRGPELWTAKVFDPRSKEPYSNVTDLEISIKLHSGTRFDASAQARLTLFDPHDRSTTVVAEIGMAHFIFYYDPTRHWRQHQVVFLVPDDEGSKSGKSAEKEVDPT